jgi:hypothetical protein
MRQGLAAFPSGQLASVRAQPRIEDQCKADMKNMKGNEEHEKIFMSFIFFMAFMSDLLRQRQRAPERIQRT